MWRRVIFRSRCSTGMVRVVDTLAALRMIHRPASDADAALLLRGQHPAQQRLIREELLAHQLCMRMLRNAVKTRPVQPLNVQLPRKNIYEDVFLPFKFTGAQRVLGWTSRRTSRPSARCCV